MSMSSCCEKKNKVTLLHKGMGPRLFQYRGDAFPVHYQDVVHTRTCSGPQSTDLYSPKRTIYKCVEDKEANYMYRKRLQYEKNPPKLYYSSGGSCTPTKCDAGVIRTKREIQRQTAREQRSELELTSKSSKTEIRLPKGFPPTSFMPKWNPRKMDRTYLDRMVLEDPWSLSSSQRAEIQKKTGLRLKTISKHYQFKVASNLTYGKEALKEKCRCYVDFCDHCNKSHEFRCPLHMQWLDPVQADCKVEMLKICPVFHKRPEEMKLDEIQDVSVYISEVMRRLKAGEICEAPPFPARFDMNKANLLDGKPVQESSSLLDTSRRPPVETEGTQTDDQDTDVKVVMDNIAQTMRPQKDEPMMLSVLKSIENEIPFRPYPTNEEKEVQVGRCDAPKGEWQNYFKSIIQHLSRKILTQSIQEVCDEATIESYEKEKREYEQQCLDMERRFEFTLYQETFRMNAHLQQKIDLEVELGEDAIVETLLGAIAFARSCMSTLPAKAMQAFWSLGPGGVPINDELAPFTMELNHEVRRNLIHRIISKDLLHGMTQHALFDLELDYFRRHMVDAKYLNPVYITTKSLRELVELRDETIATLQKIREILLKKGFFTSDSLQSMDMFVENVRVSVDSKGVPKYLVDPIGRKLPINVTWIPILETVATSEVEDSDGKSKSVWDSNKTFNIILESESMSSTSSSKEGEEDEDEEDDEEDEDQEPSKDNLVGNGRSIQFVLKKSFRYDDDDDDYIDHEHNDDGRVLFRRTFKDDNDE